MANRNLSPQSSRESETDKTLISDAYRHKGQKPVFQSDLTLPPDRYTVHLIQEPIFQLAIFGSMGGKLM
jgi:hypothetical protein